MRFLRRTLEAADFSRGHSAQELLRNNFRPEDGALLALACPDCLLADSFLGIPVSLDPGLMPFPPEKAFWLNPATGSLSPVPPAESGVYAPPRGDGLHDFVLILATDAAAQRFERMAHG